MSEEVKPEVIKKTQDSLKRHIKKPPLTEKLLKKPPFRFLHDIITSVIRETGFLNGLFTAEELNHENIKDRDGKIAFLDKLISAVKIITGIPLSVRATKIVAGHEPTKTNELLQAIGLALDKKLDSKDVAQQLRKKVNKKPEGSDSKKSSPRDVKPEKNDSGKPRSEEKILKQSVETSDKKKLTSSTNKPKEVAGVEEVMEKKKRSTSTLKPSKAKDHSKISKSKKESSLPDSKADLNKESYRELSLTKGETEVLHAVGNEKSVTSEAFSPGADQRESHSSTVQRQSKSQEKDKPPLTEQRVAEKLADPNSPHKGNGVSDVSLPPLPQEQSEPKAQSSTQQPGLPARAPSAAPAPTELAPQAPAPVPLSRPRTAARVRSARPGAPRVRNRGEAAVVAEDFAKAAPVNLIVENDATKPNQGDEDENLVVVESVPIEEMLENHQPSAPVLSRPSSQQGHLVAQILETQKELEVGTAGPDNGEVSQYHTEIEWEAGKKRERETAMKEVDRMRSLIQALTRAAHPLGKLFDSLQEDVDNMQRELHQWQSMQTSVEQQLQTEESLCTQASQPLKEQLKQLQQAIRSQLDQISAAKANIINNDDRIRRLLTGGQS